MFSASSIVWMKPASLFIKLFSQGKSKAVNNFMVWRSWELRLRNKQDSLKMWLENNSTDQIQHRGIHFENR